MNRKLGFGGLALLAACATSNKNVINVPNNSQYAAYLVLVADGQPSGVYKFEWDLNKDCKSETENKTIQLTDREGKKHNNQVTYEYLICERAENKLTLTRMLGEEKWRAVEYKIGSIAARFGPEGSILYSEAKVNGIRVLDESKK